MQLGSGMFTGQVKAGEIDVSVDKCLKGVSVHLCSRPDITVMVDWA